MPFENDRKVYGTGIRTWQFIRPLLSAGHKVCACTYAIPSAYSSDFKSVINREFTVDEKEFPQSTDASADNRSFLYNVLSAKDFENTALLKDLYVDFNPDCIIGCSFYPSFIASKLINYLESYPSGAEGPKTVKPPGHDAGHNNSLNQYSKPLWADLFGHVMAEAQARAAADDDDGCLFHYWNSEYNIITVADIFSCVSERQKYALAGELGAAGRLNKYTSGYEFAYTIPCGMQSEEFIHKKNVIRGIDNVSESDFVVLWTGGYNTWTDVDTLFAGLEGAMKANPSIKFVSTGGEIPEQDLKTYPRFLSMIEKSPFRKNFIMKGWIAGEDVPNYYFEADVGINIDKDIYEVKLGSKNRILDWMRAGLAVLSSNVCELTEIIERQSVGFTFRAQDAASLSSTVLYLSKNRQEVKETAQKGRTYALKHFNFDITTEPLKNWVKLPGFAPDYKKEHKIFFDREEALKNLQSISLKQNEMIKERDLRVRQLELLVHRNPFYRFYGYTKTALRKISRKK